MPPKRLTVDVYDDDATTLLGTLGEDRARGLTVVKNDAGAGTFTVPLGSADVALCATQHVARIKLDGVVVGGFIVKRRSRVRVSPSEGAGRLLTCSGPGIATLLNRGVLEPERAWEEGLRAPQTRTFNFSSRDYPTAGLPNAVVVSAPAAPATWPAAAAPAQPIWGQAPGGGSPPQPVGSVYLLGLMNNVAEQTYAFIITADDGYRLWVDNELVAEQTEAFLWQQTKRHDVFLDPGWHTVGIEGINIDRPSSVATNIAWVRLSVCTIGSDGEPLANVMATDPNWLAITYPATAPALTPGAIWTALFTEAHNRGALLGIGTDATAALDSNGQSWATPIAFQFRVGETYLSILRQMAESVVDWRFNAATLTLRLFNKGSMGAVSGVTLDPTSDDLSALTIEDEDDEMTDALVQYGSRQWAWIDNPVAGGARKEGHLQIGAADSTHAAQQITEAAFEKVVGGTLTGAVSPATPEPLVAWTVGDFVNLPNIENDTPTTTEMVEITVTDDDAHTGAVDFSFVGRQS